MRILITGASRGIGRSTALTLGDEHAIAVNYNNSAAAAAEIVDTITEQGGTATAVQADVSDPDEATAMVDRAVSELGGLDAVVNNAGIVEPDLLTDIDNNQWDRVIGTNLSGAFYTTRAAVSHLAPGGDLVFISSIGGTSGTVDPSYAASKAGLHGLTRSVAREYGQEGVQVNAIAPGPADTAMNDEIVEHLEQTEFRGHESVDTHLPQYACQPAAVVNTVAYLLDNEYIQGEVVNVNGGMQFQ
jgi:Dehydrogenases with different specificities (related to short-chain alcohol dehydrogenases)